MRADGVGAERQQAERRARELGDRGSERAQVRGPRMLLGPGPEHDRALALLDTGPDERRGQTPRMVVGADLGG